MEIEIIEEDPIFKVSMNKKEAECQIKNELIYIAVSDADKIKPQKTGNTSLDYLLQMADVLLQNQDRVDMEDDDEERDCEIVEAEIDILDYKLEVHDLDEMSNLVPIDRPHSLLKYVFYPDTCITGRKIKERYYCTQQIFRKV